MPRKKKVTAKSRLAEAHQCSDSDEQVEVATRAPRTRARTRLQSPQCTTLKSKQAKNIKTVSTEEQHRPDNGYEADSEFDQRQSSDSDGVDNHWTIAISTGSEDDTDEKRRKKLSTKGKGNENTQPKDECFCIISREKIDKENFTPPGSHSTPSLGQSIARNLDDSLFGFNRLESPLQLSPISSISSRGRLSPRIIKPNLSSVSSHKNKRKSEKMFDFKIDNERKAKKKKAKREPCIDENYLEELREQFKEVEMHELTVENY